MRQCAWSLHKCVFHHGVNTEKTPRLAARPAKTRAREWNIVTPNSHAHHCPRDIRGIV